MKKTPPERKEYKIKGRRKLYSLVSDTGFKSKIKANKEANKIRNDGFKARVSNFENRFYVYHHN